MRGSEAAFALYRTLRGAVDRFGLARVPIVGTHVLQPLGSLARRAIIGRADMSIVEVRGQKMHMDPNIRSNSIRFADPFFYYMSFARGDYERGTTRVFEDDVKDGMVVVDVGAHVGYYTLIAARKVGPSGTVIAFEPNPSNFGVLSENIRLNGYDNVRPVQMAVSDRAGTVDMYLSDVDSQDHSLYKVPLISDRKITVETTALDDFFDEKKWPRVDFIKIDVEGAEPAVLRGMAGLARRMPNLTLVVECNPFTLAAAGATRGQVLRRIHSLGFDVKTIADNGLEDVDEERLERLAAGVNLLCVKRYGGELDSHTQTRAEPKDARE